MNSNTNNDPRARLAQAQAAIAEVDNHELMLQRQAEARQQKKAQAIATLKATLPEVLRADVATQKDTLAAITETNRKAAQAAQAKLTTAAAALDKALSDVRNAIAEVEATYTRHDEQARQIHAIAWQGYQEIIELDRDNFIKDFGEARAQMELERRLNTTYGTFIGRLPAAIDPIATMLMAIQATKNPIQRRLLQGIVWAISNAPNGSTPDPSPDWQPQADYQFRRG